MWRRYLMWFAQEHVDFRHAEMQSILTLFNIPIKFVENPCIQKPYWIVELPSEEYIKKIASRSVLVKNCIELWARAKTESQLHENLKSALKNDTGEWLTGGKLDDNETCDKHICPSTLIKSCCPANKSFKVEVETFCKHFSMAEKVAKIEYLGSLDYESPHWAGRLVTLTEPAIASFVGYQDEFGLDSLLSFSYLPLEGTVKLKNPNVTLAYLEFYGMDPNNVPEKPHDLFFGKWVTDGQRDLIQHLSLKKRQFIGNTSMDAQLSIIMANQAQVKSGDLLLDPFVGSGSLLVAAAHFGAYVLGSDIDFMMLHARTRPTRVGQKERDKDESIRSNMIQYGTESRYVDVIVSDFSLPNWHQRLKLDAIVTDPPYGVREPTEKIGIERENYTLSEEHLVNHVPSKVDYGLSHIYSDLLNFAARHLELGKRLVCWYPLVRDEYKEDQLPCHPCLKLIANSEQVLSKLTARRLLTYEKIHDDVPNMPVDPNAGVHNFREKYFSMGEMTRKERKEKRAEEVAANIANRVLSVNVT